MSNYNSKKSKFISDDDSSDESTSDNESSFYESEEISSDVESSDVESSDDESTTGIQTRAMRNRNNTSGTKRIRISNVDDLNNELTELNSELEYLNNELQKSDDDSDNDNMREITEDEFVSFLKIMTVLANASNDDTKPADDGKDLSDDIFEPLIKEIAEQTYAQNPNDDKGLIYEAARNAVAPKKREFREKYGISKPKIGWKSEVSEADIENLESIEKRIKDEMEDDRPTEAKILQAHIPFSAKKQAYNQFLILKNLEANTFTYNSVKETINNLIRPTTISGMSLDDMDIEEERLLKSVPDYNKDMRLKILNMKASDSDKAVMLSMVKQMNSYSSGSSKHMNLKKKLSFMVDLPFNNARESKFKLVENGIINRQQLNEHLRHVRSRLDEKLYGMDTIKDKIIQIRNNQITCPGAKSILAFKGASGLGKTSLAAAIAYAFDLPFEKISIAGMDDPSIFLGTNQSWSGSDPGIMLQILRKTKVNNPVVLIDEVEKVEGTSKGISVQYALFEILDFEQNHSTQDLFLDEFTHDLSNIFYIISMNDDKKLHPALRSRLEIIELSDYKDDEVQAIIEKHLVPRAVKEIGLLPDSVSITSQASQELIRQLGKFDGHYDIRVYKNELFKIVSKLNYFETIRHTSGSNNNKKSKKRSFDIIQMESLNFKGFPFTITESLIPQLTTKKQKKVHLSYYM